MFRALFISLLLLLTQAAWADEAPKPAVISLESKLSNVREISQQAKLNPPHSANSLSAIGADAQSEFRTSALSGLQALLLVLAALMFVVFALRKFYKVSPLSNSKRLKVKERLAITSKTALVLIEMDGRSMLVSVGPERVSFSGQGDGLVMNEAELAQEVGLLCPGKALA